MIDLNDPSDSNIIRQVITEKGIFFLTVSDHVSIASLGADGKWYKNGYDLDWIPQYWMYLPKAIDENI